MSQQAIRTEITGTDADIERLFGEPPPASGTIPVDQGVWRRESADHWVFYKFTE